jgi:hypothetical protein
MPNICNKGFIFVLSHFLLEKQAYLESHFQMPLSFIYVYIHVCNLMGCMGY